ncbi:MAG: helix-turn-helix domain-containing protein [Wenzhouxiangella sp.]
MTDQQQASSHADQQNNQQTPINHYAEIGQQLATARLDQGLERDQVARSLHLTTSVVASIESGRIDHVAPIYRRGYISNYARLLGLDPAPLLTLLSQEPPPDLKEVLPVDRRASRLDRHFKRASYALATAVVVIPLVFFYVDTGSRILDQDYGQPAMTDISEAGETQRVDTLTRLSRAIGGDYPAETTDTDLRRRTSASALPVRPLADSRLDETPASVTTPAEEVVTSLEPEPIDPRRQLMLRLNDDSWVEVYDANDRRLEFDLLRAGAERSYLAEPPFRLLLGRANAVELSVDDQLVVFDGQNRSGLVQLRLDEDGNVIRND